MPLKFSAKLQLVCTAAGTGATQARCAILKVRMLPATIQPRRLPAGFPPRLIAVVDTEEEFDWFAPHSREAVSVHHMSYIGRLQDVFDARRVQPSYMVDYPVASQSDGFAPLRAFADQGRAAIGAHLHPWVTPPAEEELSRVNSFHGNLPRALEFAKLENLTGAIERNFGRRPTTFKAGRYGIGSNTYGILAALGYRVDLSPAPALNSSAEGGPDFSDLPCYPFQDLTSGLLVLPWTGAFCGWAPGNRAALNRWVRTAWRPSLRAPTFLYRSNALREIHLTPENTSLDLMIQLTGELYRKGQRCFVVALHSPSVMAGGAPYANTDAEVADLLGRLDRYLAFFFGEFGGQPWTPEAALEHWSLSSDWFSKPAASPVG
jgi:hypothetical protein